MRCRLALLALVFGLLAPARSEARPVSPRSGGFEIGGAGFIGVVGDEQGNVPDRLSGGPLLHLGLRGPVSESVLLALVGRFGLGSGRGSSGAIGSLALEARGLIGSEDLAPFGLIGLGVLFQQASSDDGLRLVSRPSPALPVGLGIESRLSDVLMLGFTLRYTLVLSHLTSTIGPVDFGLTIVFL